MAKSGKGGHRRAMPSTPTSRDRADSASRATPPKADTGATAPTSRSAPSGGGQRPSAASGEPDYLVTGTGCTAGHVRGRELDAGRIGRVPSRRATRVGLFLVLWCAIGLGLVVDPAWIGFGLQVLALWLAFSAIVQRRAGHRGHCWRTRSWRHAWGGLAPSGVDRKRASRS
jgi:hypothetical protein